MRFKMRDPHQAALIAAARRQDIEAEDLLPQWGLDAVRYHRAGRSALIIEGCTFERLSHITDRLCANKQATRCWLAELDLPVPEGVTLEPGLSPEAVASRLPTTRPLVCKPLDGTNGEGVVMGLVNIDEIMVAAKACWEEGPALVESQISGADLRIQVIGGEIVAACERRPASVTGDGRATIAAL
ncbi:MAG: cyanophycin synthetase, partial [Myxococcota bacterium]